LKCPFCWIELDLLDEDDKYRRYICRNHIGCSDRGETIYVREKRLYMGLAPFKSAPKKSGVIIGPSSEKVNASLDKDRGCC